MGTMTVHTLAPAPLEPQLPAFKPARPTGPLPMPANDNWFNRPVPGGGKLRIILRVGVGLPLIDTLFNVAEGLDSWQWYADGEPFKVGGPWYEVLDSGRRPGNPPYLPNNAGPYWEARSGHVANDSSGQVPAASIWQALPYEPLQFDGAVNFGSNLSLFLSDSRFTTALRMRHDKVWWVDAGSTFQAYALNWAPYRPAPFTDPMADPNIVRPLPSSPGNVPEAENWPRPAPRPRPENPPEWEWDSGPERAPRPRARFRSKRPGKGDKKIITMSRAFMIWLFNALDGLSENSEVVGAFFDALPEDVQKRWSKGREDRPFVDNGGQYGIDGVDWKLEAIYHNWHKIDAEEALWNVSRNLLQDQFYGVVHKNLPPGTFRATTGDSTDFNDLVEKLLDLVDPRSYR